MKYLTCPLLIFYGNNHEINSHEEVSESEICQKTGLNRMIITSDQAPGYHGQVTKHCKDTEQPNTLPGAWGLDHAIAT